MAESDQAIRDIVAHLAGNGSQDAPAMAALMTAPQAPVQRFGMMPVLEAARAQLATQPQRLVGVLPDVGEPAVSDGGRFSEGTAVGDKAADIASRMAYGAGTGLATLPRRALEASAADVGHLGQEGYEPQSIAPAVETALTVMGGSGAVPAEANSLRAGIKAYHGSPHDFDAFDLSKIGTGEGAQAYGHGLYFAENERVAKQYRDDLANAISANGQRIMANNRIVGSTGNKSVDDMLMAHGGDVDAAISDLQNHMQGLTPGQLARAGHQGDLDLLNSLRGKVTTTNEGKMYEVNINADPEHFLDWDKSLSEQPQAVQDLYNAKVAPGLKTREIGNNPHLGPLTDVIHPEGGSLGTFTRDQLPDVLANPAKYTPTRGRDFIDSMARLTGDSLDSMGLDHSAASTRLREAGIPGIKYLDQGSRGAGQGSSNYVVFNDKLIDIMRKYGMGSIAALPPAALALAGQNDQRN